jgi:hypothetical protein
MPVRGTGAFMPKPTVPSWPGSRRWSAAVTSYGSAPGAVGAGRLPSSSGSTPTTAMAGTVLQSGGVHPGARAEEMLRHTATRYARPVDPSALGEGDPSFRGHGGAVVQQAGLGDLGAGHPGPAQPLTG